MKRKRGKRLAINLILLAVSIIISLLAVEAFIRVFALSPSQRDHQLFMEYDELLGWKKRPDFVGMHVTSEYSTEERINSAGIRGPEYPYEKPGGEYRIAVLGDSYAEGYTVEFGELFSEVLKKELNELDIAPPVEVINLGTGGYSTDQQLLLFEAEGRKYSPDLTVLMFYDNDIWYNIQPAYWRGNKPLFQLDDDGSLQLTNVPVPEGDSTSDLGEDDDSSGSALKNWLAEKSELYQFVVTRAENTPALYQLGVKLGLIDVAPGAEEDGRIPIPDEYRIYKRRMDADIAEAWEVTEALIVRLDEEIKAAGGDLLIFHVPVRFSVYDTYWTQMKEQYDLSEEGWSIDEVENKLKQFCDDRGFDCMEPVAAFRQEADRLQTTGQELYFAEDRHWNALGHNFAGRILAAYVAGSWLPEPQD